MVTGVVGERGQITIPKEMRKLLGLKPKTSVVMEVTPQGLLIHPTVTVKIRSFTAEFIDETTGNDIVQPGERKTILGKWSK